MLIFFRILNIKSISDVYNSDRMIIANSFIVNIYAKIVVLVEDIGVLVFVTYLCRS